MNVTETSITGIANVEIFRNSTLLATIPPTALSYMDATVKGGQTYTYSAVNVDGSNVPSVPTGLVTAIIPPDSTTAQYSFVISPTSLSFNGTVGGSNPPSQAVQVGDTGPSGYHVPFTATSQQSWIHVTSSSTQTAAVLTVTMDTTGLAQGLDTGYIDVVGGTTDSPRHITVNLTMVNAPVPTYTINCPTTSNATSSCSLKGMTHGQSLLITATDETGKVVAKTSAHRN